MNWLDIFFIVAVGISVVIGVLRGFVRECFSLASYVIGYLVASGTYTLFAANLHGIINHPQGREIFSFASIFILVVILVNLTGKFLRRLIYKARALSAADRLVGLTFGFARGVLILALLMIPLSLFTAIGSPALRNSTLAPYLINISRELSNWAFSEENMGRSVKFRTRIDIFKKNLSGNINSVKQATKSAKKIVAEKAGTMGGKESTPSQKEVKGASENKGTNITQKDREKLNQLLEQF